MNKSSSDLSPEERAAFKRRIEALDEKLERTRDKPSGKSTAADKPANNSAARYGIRMVSDFIAAIAVGAVIGYGLDRFLGTSPWILLVMLLFGFAAGVVGLMRTYKKMQAEIDRQTGGDIGKSIEPYDDD